MSASLDEVEVLERNRAFYTAFRRRDMATMESLWARSAKVACVHPGWQPIRGRGEVMASLSAILGQPQVPQIRCEDVSVHVVGDAAFVVCEEVLHEGRLVATNVFVREEGDWRLLHHQAGPMAPDAEPDLGELTDDLSDLEAGGDAEDGADLGAFTSGPLAMGRRTPRPLDFTGAGADLRAQKAGIDLSGLGAGELSDPSFDVSADGPSDGPASESDEIDDDESLGPGPLFHSPSDELLCDPDPGPDPGPGPACELGDDEADSDGPRSAPAAETRPVADIADLGEIGGSLRRSPRPARRLLN